jgi:hypothetical protein
MELSKLFGGVVAAVVLLCGLPACAAATPGILVLSNRADLISGGDALIEIKWPAGANLSTSTIIANGMAVTTSFAVRPNGRYLGLVTGLRDGANVLLARYSGGAAQIGTQDFTHDSNSQRPGILGRLH